MRSPLNRDVPLPRPGEFQPLRFGPIEIDPPVVLAPMAGVTNAPFRTLCRRFSSGRCLYVSEMITARSFVTGHTHTQKLASFGAEESLKSIQLYGTHPGALGEAARILSQEWGVDHIDMNFGCPVRKVTAAGGGSAIPARPRLLGRLIRAVVEKAGDVPVTIKFRKGIQPGLETHLDAGRVAVEEGCRAVALHGRYASELYHGEADWNAIAELKAAVTSIPVLGNGDVFEAFDALRLMRQTGCDGVVVGRGCLGRPWLFRELVEVFGGSEPSTPPNLGEIRQIVLEHADLLIDFFGERVAMNQIRKFTGWYLKSFPGVRAHLDGLHRVTSRADLRSKLEALDETVPFPEGALRVRRGKGGRTQTVALPDGYLDDRDSDQPPKHDPADAELGSMSGG